MRNRAKCKLCKSVIESFHEFDYVDCLCGEISIHGGNVKLGCSAKDFSNFLRVDDLDNEIIVKTKTIDEKDQETSKEEQRVPTKEELIDLLDDMIKNIENLPNSAMYTPINHADYCCGLILLRAIFKSWT